MTTVAPSLPVEPLIAEAKERARRRRFIALGVLALLGAAGATASTLSLGAGGSSGDVPWLPTKPNIGPANPPLAAACTAAQLHATLGLQGAGEYQAGGGISLVNTSSTPCALTGRPELSLAGAGSTLRVSGHGAQAMVPFDPLAPPFGSLRALEPGRHVSVGLIWSAAGPSCAPLPKNRTALVLTAPGGGRIDLSRNATNGGSGFPSCFVAPGATLAATRFTPFVPEAKPSSRLPLKASIVSGRPVTVKGTTLTGPSFVASRNAWLSFTVVLTNTGTTPYRFGKTCPAYTEDWGGLVRATAYVLNCHPVGAIAPGRSVDFGMRIRVPNTKLPVPAFGWTLAPHTYDPPIATADVLLR